MKTIPVPVLRVLNPRDYTVVACNFRVSYNLAILVPLVNFKHGFLVTPEKDFKSFEYLLRKDRITHSKSGLRHFRLNNQQKLQMYTAAAPAVRAAVSQLNSTSLWQSTLYHGECIVFSGTAAETIRVTETTNTNAEEAALTC